MPAASQYLYAKECQAEQNELFHVHQVSDYVCRLIVVLVLCHKQFAVICI